MLPHKSPKKMLSHLQGKFGTQLLSGGIKAIFVQVGSIIAGLVASVVLARALGPEAYGIYAFVLALVTLLGLPVQLGLPTMIVRETARAAQSGRGELIGEVWRWSDRVMLVMSSVVVCISGAYICLVTGADSTRMLALICALPLVPLIGFSEARGAAIRGLRRVALGTAPDKILRPLLLAGTISVIGWVSAVPLTAADVYLVHCGVALVTVIVASVIAIRIRPNLSANTPISLSWSRISALLPLSALAGLQVVSQNTDILMLGVLALDAEIGLYRVALSGANMALFGLTAINLVSQPYFAGYYSAGDHHKLQIIASGGARISLLASLLFLALFWFDGIWLLSLVYGEDYAGAFWALVLLCLSQVVSAFFGSAGNLLIMSGREWIAVIGLIASTLVNVGLNWLLIPLYGIEGAAVATGISIVVWNTVLWFATWVTLNIDSSILGLHRSPSPATLTQTGEK